MKSRGILALLLAGLALAASPARAGEEGGSDWRFEVGSKLWIQSWDTKQNAGSGPYVDNAVGLPQYSNHASANHATAAAGNPYLYVGWRKWFVTGSYLGSAVFDFPETREIIANVNGAAAANRAFEVHSKVDATRTEGDISLGYMLFPQVGVTAGYKGARLSYDEYTTGHLVGDVTTKLLPRTSRSLFSYDGVVLGIAAGADLGAGFQIYGVGGGGWMKGTLRDRTNNVDVDYDWGSVGYEVAELGFKYAYMPWHLKFQVGYKYQGINAVIAGRDLTSNAKLERIATKDVTTGYVVGMGLAF